MIESQETSGRNQSSGTPPNLPLFYRTDKIDTEF